MPPKKIVYPVFLPHAGCPFQCVYCNQRAVTGTAKPEFVGQAARERIAMFAEEVRKTGRNGEIAFYGGTFTALPLALLRTLLDRCSENVSDGVFTGIRFSTRPDCMEGDMCRFLADYPVSTVELGVQSLCDPVLDASGRGYSVQTVVDAAKRVREQGWSLGIQLMAGLPEDTPDRFLDSVRRSIAVGPDFLRIYPTIVLEGTRLAEWFRSGLYRALSVDEAVEWIVPAYELLVSAGIPIVRLGLHADPALDLPGTVLAGPHHPAFGYLVRCRWWRGRVDRKLDAAGGAPGKKLTVKSAPDRRSELIGAKKSNVDYWKTRWRAREISILTDPDLCGTDFRVETAD